MRRPVIPISLLIGMFIVGTTASAATISFRASVDDYAVLTIDGIQVLSYDDWTRAGSVEGSIDLAPGLHDIRLDYRNQYGSQALWLGWKTAGETAYTVISAENLFSQDAAGNTINGLRADYTDYSSPYGSDGKANFDPFTIYGEGPIWHNYNDVYEGQAGVAWAEKFSGWPWYFSETLSGSLLVGGDSVPEPTSLVLWAGLGVMGLAAARRKRRQTA